MTPTEAREIIMAEHPHARVHHVGQRAIILSNHNDRPLGMWAHGSDAAWISAARIMVQQRRIESVLEGDEVEGDEPITADMVDEIIESN